MPDFWKVFVNATNCWNRYEYWKTLILVYLPFFLCAETNSYSGQLFWIFLLDLLCCVCVIIRFKKDSANIWRPNVQRFPDSTSCQMMNFWRFCPRLKILLLFSLICENALRILPRLVVLRALLLWLTMQGNPSCVQVVVCFTCRKSDKEKKCVEIRRDTLTQPAFSSGNNKR